MLRLHTYFNCAFPSLWYKLEDNIIIWFGHRYYSVLNILNILQMRYLNSGLGYITWCFISHSPGLHKHKLCASLWNTGVQVLNQWGSRMGWGHSSSCFHKIPKVHSGHLPFSPSTGSIAPAYVTVILYVGGVQHWNNHGSCQEWNKNWQISTEVPGLESHMKFCFMSTKRKERTKVKPTYLQGPGSSHLCEECLTGSFVFP